MHSCSTPHGSREGTAKMLLDDKFSLLVKCSSTSEKKIELGSQVFRIIQTILLMGLVTHLYLMTVLTLLKGR